MSDLNECLKIDFNLLYEHFCSNIENNKLSIILLYTFLNNNISFLNFVIARKDIENLIVPCIKVLENNLLNQDAFTFRRRAQQSYVGFLVIFILSRDDFFCKKIHEIVIKKNIFNLILFFIEIKKCYFASAKSIDF